MAKREEILEVLNDLLKLDDVLACMVAKKGLEGIVPSNIKVKNVDLWVLLIKTTDRLFDLIEQFYDYGNTRATFEIDKYVVITEPISRNNSLIVVIPELANRGLLNLEIENTKRKIKKIIS